MRKVTHGQELKCASDSYELLTVNSYHIMKCKQKWVTGSALCATSGSVDPAYMRPGHSWLWLSVPSKGPYSGLQVIHEEH